MDKSIYSDEHQRLCALLRRLRREAGLTQVQVAERLDVPQSFVSKYESGERRLDIVELRFVAEALSASLADIVEQMDLTPAERAALAGRTPPSRNRSSSHPGH